MTTSSSSSSAAVAPSTPTSSSSSSSSVDDADDEHNDEADAEGVDLPTVTSSGYVSNGPGRGGGKLFWAYYEKEKEEEEAEEETAAAEGEEEGKTSDAAASAASESSDDGDDDSDDDETPIFIWLEGGPGCASTFGAMYINGPDRVLASRDPLTRARAATGKLRRNAHAWNRAGGLLYVDQPVGTGFSVPGGGGGEEEEGKEEKSEIGGGGIPEDELGVASDLYWGLCELFGAGGALAGLARRPLFITGESYAGKFVPSIAHFIVQAEREAQERSRVGGKEEESEGDDDDDDDDGSDESARKKKKKEPSSSFPSPRGLRVRRDLLRGRRRRGGDSPEQTPPPPFRLVGIAVGNGLVDPGSQVLTHASSLYNRGLIDDNERARTMAAALSVSSLVRASRWSEAHAARAALLSRLSDVSGVGTLLDARRYEDYDSGNAVDQYFNIPAVRAALRVNESLYDSSSDDSGGRKVQIGKRRYAACSDAVARAMDTDIMRSTSRLFRDVLDSGIRVLVYAGNEDVQDGAAATDVWLSRLRWRRSREFFSSGSPRRRWELRVGGGDGGGGGGGGVAVDVDDERYGGGSACSSAEGGSSSDEFDPSSSVLLSKVQKRKTKPTIDIGRLVEPKPFSSSSSSSSASPLPSSSDPSPPSPSPRPSPASVVVGYWRSGGGLDHVTVRNGGHMLPHDQPAVSLAMLSRWSGDVVGEGRRRRGKRDIDVDIGSPSSSGAAAAVV